MTTCIPAQSAKRKSGLRRGPVLRSCQKSCVLTRWDTHSTWWPWWKRKWIHISHFRCGLTCLVTWKPTWSAPISYQVSVPRVNFIFFIWLGFIKNNWSDCRRTEYLNRGVMKTTLLTKLSMLTVCFGGKKSSAFFVGKDLWSTSSSIKLQLIVWNLRCGH